ESGIRPTGGEGDVEVGTIYVAIRIKVAADVERVARVDRARALQAGHASDIRVVGPAVAGSVADEGGDDTPRVGQQQRVAGGIDHTVECDAVECLVRQWWVESYLIRVEIVSRSDDRHDPRQIDRPVLRISTADHRPL